MLLKRSRARFVQCNTLQPDCTECMWQSCGVFLSSPLQVMGYVIFASPTLWQPGHQKVILQAEHNFLFNFTLLHQCSAALSARFCIPAAANNRCRYIRGRINSVQIVPSQGRSLVKMRAEHVLSFT